MQELKLEVDGVEREFQVPNEWSEVSVDKFTRIFKIDRENLTDIEISVQVVEILTGIDEDTLYMFDPTSFGTVAEIIDFTNVDVKGEQVDSITVGGDEYFLKKDFESLTMGEVISIELLIEKSGGDMSLMMIEMLCIFLRKKVNGKLESFKKSFMDRVDIFKDVKITEVNDLFLFFSDGVNSSGVSTKDSLEK